MPQWRFDKEIRSELYQGPKRIEMRGMKKERAF